MCGCKRVCLCVHARVCVCMCTCVCVCVCTCQCFNLITFLLPLTNFVFHPQSESNRNGKPGEKMKIQPIPGPVRIFQDGDKTQKPAEGHKHKRKPAATDSRATQTDDSLLEDLIHKRLEQGSKRDHSLVEAEEDEAVELMVKGVEQIKQPG